MEVNNFQNKIVNATKWSTITEIAAKLVNPVTNMILARILVPEAFGVVATVTMIISFVDMFTDSGFQKYLVQHEFKDDDEKYKNANVAFWANLALSIFLAGIVVLFSEQLSEMVGSPGLGVVLVVSSIQLPMTSFSSIQMALYRRDFDFKTLFLVRMISVCIPFVVTVPLALLGLSYWALIIGTICTRFSDAAILTIKSKWKPGLFFRWKLFKEMYSFSVWSLVEEISIWLSLWIDTFIIGNQLSSYYLGLYKTSTSMVNALTALVTSSVVPILFSALSRSQENKEQFDQIYFKFNRFVSVLIFPLGIGIYLYSDLATKILLGSQWSQASGVIAIWALTRSIKIVFGNFSSEVYRAKGRPKLSFLAQTMHLVVLIPACMISVQYGFWPLVYARSWIQMQFVLVHFLVMQFAVGISALKTIKNVLPTAISAAGMGVLGYLLQQVNSGVIWSFISIVICAISYFGILFLFPSMRLEILNLAKRLVPRGFISKYKAIYSKD